MKGKKAVLYGLILAILYLSALNAGAQTPPGGVMPVLNVEGGKPGQVAWWVIAPAGSHINQPENFRKMVAVSIVPLSIKGESSSSVVTVPNFTPYYFDPTEEYEVYLIIDSNFNFNPIALTGIDAGDMLCYKTDISFEHNEPYTIDLEAGDCITIPRQSTVYFDTKKKYQKIDGFGAFGLRNVNWSDPSTWWTDEWGDHAGMECDVPFLLLDGNFVI